jgi:hypothetical protein
MALGIYMYVKSVVGEKREREKKRKCYSEVN